MDQDWDVAIILDACRFDFFERFYRYFFEGELLKITSRGSCTSEWFKNTFTSLYSDTIYISANPFINSSPLQFGGFSARSRFARIIDVWVYALDLSVGHSFAKQGHKTLLDTLKRGRDKRIIAHHLQPHTLYICQDTLFLVFQLQIFKKEKF